MQQPSRDLEQLRAFMSSMGPTAFLDMPWIPIFLLGLFLFHPAIGMTALLGTISIVAMTVADRTLVARRGQGRDGFQRTAAGARGHHPAQCRGHSRARHDRIDSGAVVAINERYLRENMRATDLFANLGSGAKVLRYVLQSGMLGVGAYLVVTDSASGGIMIASSIMMGRALAPVEVAFASWKQLVAARQGIARLRDICKVTARAAGSAGDSAAAVPRTRPCRSLRSRRPPPTRPSSRISVSRSRPAWAWRCSGPAHPARPRFPRRWSEFGRPAGVVRLDGAAIDQWRNEDLGRHIGYLPQDVALFDGTIAENICRFDERATSEAILKAAQIAGVHDSSCGCRRAIRPRSVRAACRCRPASGRSRTRARRLWRSVSGRARRAQRQSRCRRRERAEPRHPDPAPEQEHRYRDFASPERALPRWTWRWCFTRKVDRLRFVPGGIRSRRRLQDAGARRRTAGAQQAKTAPRRAVAAERV